MNRNKKTFINIIVILLLTSIFLNSNNLSITPTRAFETFEKRHHYGPSEIVHQTSHSGNKYFIAQYDKWFSMVIVERSLLFFWSNASASIGTEINKNEAVNVQSLANQKNEKIIYEYFGRINDKRIDRIQIKQQSGDIIEITEFFDNMFIYVDSFEARGQSNIYFEYLNYKLTAYDKKNNIIYESEFNQY